MQVSEEDVANRRADAIRKLSQGAGILSSRYEEPIDGDAFDLFEVADKAELQTKLRELLDLMPVNKLSESVGNALNLRDMPGNLSERRNQYMEHLDAFGYKVTYRTLVRRESAGALAMAHLYGVHGARAGVTVRELANSVAVLQWMVTSLVEQVGQDAVFRGIFGRGKPGDLDSPYGKKAFSLMSGSFIKLHDEAWQSFQAALEADSDAGSEGD